MFGSVDEFFYRYLAGIQSPEDEGTSRGYRQIRIQPFIPEDLSFVKASINTVTGKIESEWQHKEGSLLLKVNIPANSTAIISIPVKNAKVSVTESGKKIWENDKFIPGAEGITDGSFDDNHLTFKTGSGKYEFVSQ
jgi:alpha-L-rhamnosidase